MDEFYGSYKRQMTELASHTSEFKSQSKQHAERKGTERYLLKRSANVVCSCVRSDPLVEHSAIFPALISEGYKYICFQLYINAH